MSEDSGESPLKKVIAKIHTMGAFGLNEGETRAKVIGSTNQSMSSKVVEGQVNQDKTILPEVKEGMWQNPLSRLIIISMLILARASVSYGIQQELERIDDPVKIEQYQEDVSKRNATLMRITLSPETYVAGQAWMTLVDGAYYIQLELSGNE